jgi:sugar phosphate isomerase/epimerase
VEAGKNRGMIKFGICNEIFDGWDMKESMAFAKKAGYDAIEIAPFTINNDVTQISAEKRKEVRDAAAEVGIEISGIHWVLVKTEGMHLTIDDETVRQKTSDYLVELVNFCHDLGGTRIVVGSPYQRNLEEGVTFEQGWERATEAFKASVKRAEETGIVVCFEPLAPSETNFINTAAQGIEFVEQFKSDAFKIIIDCKAMCSEEISIPEIIRASHPHFAYFHANDENLKGPGFGDVDFKPIAAALKEVGYDGYVSVEVFKFEEGAEAIATQSIDYLKKCFA